MIRRVSAAYWHDLFVATASATAALTGLLFVAVSLNIERILTFLDLLSGARMARD